MLVKFFSIIFFEINYTCNKKLKLSSKKIKHNLKKNVKKIFLWFISFLKNVNDFIFLFK